MEVRSNWKVKTVPTLFLLSINRNLKSSTMVQPNYEHLTCVDGITYERPTEYV